MPTLLSNNFNNNTNNQLVNVSMLIEKPCPPVKPFVVTYFYGSPIGWNAVLVGLLSCVLAIIFLLLCLYYLIRRRYLNDLCDSPAPVALVEKNGGSSIPVTNASQTATTTFINEPRKETKITTFTEHASGSTAIVDFNSGMSNIANGHTGSPGTNGLLGNGSADPSELRLLQHEHH